MNLLHALDVLIEERSVSRAAKRLNVSQPTMSAALGRLREYFDDPLLIQQGRGMAPSQLALSLRPMLRDALVKVGTLINAALGFDPATSERSFCISTSDYFGLVVMPELIHRLNIVAPRVRIEIVTRLDSFFGGSVNGEIDVLMLPAQFAIEGHPSEFLFEETYVVAGWNENPLMAGAMSEDDFYGARHVGFMPQRHASIAERFLGARGRPHFVDIYASSYLYAVDLLIGTRRCMVVHRRLAEILASRLPISFVDLPFEGPPFHALLQIHSSRVSDPGILWLINQIKALPIVSAPTR